MGQALYRTYRSKKLSEIVGQEHITQALDHALTNQTISHAYLFTGPRGVGKTSIARILAHEINQLPYSDDSQHLDIIEIDAASNRRIDEIRDLRDKVHIAPTSAKFKVYIIDEVHMLTKEAFNALLKTLEEPPAHVIFILATTEVHKLPETIISRTQRYAFKPVDLDKVVEHLKTIAKQEGIAISDDALELVAAHGEGSFRDSISLLDQVRNTSAKVELKEVQGILGIAPQELIVALINALQNHDVVVVAQLTQQLYDQGFEPAQIARQLGEALREAIISGRAMLPHDQSIGLLEKLLQVPASTDPKIALQIALLDLALQGTPNPVALVPAVAPRPVQKPVAAAPKPAPAKTMSEQAVKSQPEVTVKPVHPLAKQVEETKEEEAAAVTKVEATEVPKPPVVVDPNAILREKDWQDVLTALKKGHNTLYSVGRLAEPYFEPSSITLEFSLAFHQKRMNDSRNKDIISDVVHEVTGHRVQINCIVGTGKPMDALHKAPIPAAPSADDEVVHNVQSESVSTPPPKVDNVANVSNIFGGIEVLET